MKGIYSLVILVSALALPFIATVRAIGAENTSVPTLRIRVLDVAYDEPGRLYTMSAGTNQNLIINIREEGRDNTFDVRITSLATNAVIVQGKIHSFLGCGAAAGLVVQTGSDYSYHSLLNGNCLPYISSTNWTFSAPIFTNRDTPYRVVEVANREGDTLLITFRKQDGLEREGHWWRKETPDFDERIYVDVCPPTAPSYSMRPRGQLYDVLGVRVATDRLDLNPKGLHPLLEFIGNRATVR